MKTIERVTNIGAPAEAVWAVLSDTERYPDRNPFLALEQTPIAVGQKLSVTIRPGRRTMNFRPVVTETVRDRTFPGNNALVLARP